MKRVWIVIGIVLAILIGSTLALFHLINLTDGMERSLAALSDALEAGDSARTQALAEAFQEEWEQNATLMMHYIHHDELDCVSGCAARISALARHHAYPELAAEVAKMQQLVRHIRDSEFPTLANIF